MATTYWEGTALAVAQVDTVQITAVDATPANTTYKLTVGDKSVSVVGDTDVNTTATNLATEWNASTHPYFEKITAVAATDTVTLTGDIAGLPATITSSKSGGTGTIGSVTNTTAVSGPNDWSTADNWSGDSVPQTGDVVIIANSAVSINFGLAQSAVTLAKLTIEKTFTGKIGLNSRVTITSSSGDTTDPDDIEYRPTYLNIKATLCHLGQKFGTGSPNGSGRIKIDLDSATSTVTIFDTAGTPSELGLTAVRLLANSASTIIYVRKAPGGVGLAVDEPGETTTVSKVSVSDPSTGTRVRIGSGVTITTFEQFGGDNIIEAAGTIATVDCHAGNLRTEGDYTITTFTVNGGLIKCNHIKSSGNAITTLNLNGGTVDALEASEARTWATVNHNKGGTLKRDGGVLTITTLVLEADVATITVQ